MRRLLAGATHGVPPRETWSDGDLLQRAEERKDFTTKTLNDLCKVFWPSQFRSLFDECHLLGHGHGRRVGKLHGAAFTSLHGIWRCLVHNVWRERGRLEWPCAGAMIWFPRLVCGSSVREI